jgi:hypothetical protein
LDRLIVRHELVHDSFKEQVNRIIEAQDSILRDGIGTMKSIEETMGSSSATVQAILKTVDSLQMAVNALDILVQHVTSGGSTPPIEDRQS